MTSFGESNDDKYSNSESTKINSKSLIDAKKEVSPAAQENC